MTKLKLRRSFISVLLALCVVWFMQIPFKSLIAAEMGKIDNTEMVTLTGKISIKGNEPHTYLSLITGNNIEYQLTGVYNEKIKKTYQQQIIAIEGTIERAAIGPGFPALFDVQKIVSICSDEQKTDNKNHQ